MTKEELIETLKKKNINPTYLPKEYMFSKNIENNNIFVELVISFDQFLKLDNINLNAFINDIKEFNIDKVKKIYDDLINDILQMKKVHLELLESSNLYK